MRRLGSLGLLVSLLASVESGAETAVQVSAGTSSTCAIDVTGGAWCWGSNTNQQLGDGTTTPSAVPVPVAGLAVGLTSVLSNNVNGCGLSAGGSVLCWGWGWWLGAYLPGPTPVPGLESGIAAIDPGPWGFCVLTPSGAVMCESYDPPVVVDGLDPGASMVSSGGNHNCAVVAGGARCWGLNAWGQLGEGGNVPESPSAVPVSGLATGVVSVAARGSQSCALETGGTVWCWGQNSFGELGADPTLVSLSTTPVAIAGLPADVASIGVASGTSARAPLRAMSGAGGATPRASSAPASSRREGRLRCRSRG